MTQQLRDALGTDADTPAGVDLGAVRHRAHSLRRRRTSLAAGGAAALAAAAIVVPAGLLGGGGSGPDTGPADAPAGTAAGPACPDAVPVRPANTGAGLADTLVPFTAEDALVCAYDQPPKATAPVLTGVLRLSAAETASVVTEVNGGSAEPPQACTADTGVPIVLSAAGGARVVTLTLQPYGCGTMTNGTTTRSGRTRLLRDLRDKASATSGCPSRLSVPGVAGELLPPDAGPAMLPAGTTRLLLCGYRDQDTPRTAGGWDAAVDGPEVRQIVDRVDAAPAVAGPCVPAAGVPQVLVTAVTPDGVKRVLLDSCGVFFDGTRFQRERAVGDRLLKATRQR